MLCISFDRNELETWGWCHTVRPVKAHRLTCNMTYLGHTVTLTWCDLRSNFKIDLLRIKTCGSIRLDERNTMVSKLLFWLKYLSSYSWKNISPKRTFPFGDLSYLTVLGWPPIGGHTQIDSGYPGLSFCYLTILLASRYSYGDHCDLLWK